MSEKGRKDVNQAYWNARVEHHVNSEFYDQKSFLEGRNSLNPYELELLGEVKGTSVIHFQCHFGQDTLSLARMGASCVGVDLSTEAVQTANALARSLELDATFVCCDVLETDKHVEQQFDTVFTSYGTIGWLPDLTIWADQVSKRLVKGGRLVMADFHPVLHMLDDETMSRFNYSYFNKGLIAGTETGSYADGADQLKQDYHTWNHSLSDIWNALYQHGIILETFEEYEHSPYACFSNMVESTEGYQIKGLEGKIPMVYGIVGIKK